MLQQSTILELWVYIYVYTDWGTYLELEQLLSPWSFSENSSNYAPFIYSMDCTQLSSAVN